MIKNIKNTYVKNVRSRRNYKILSAFGYFYLIVLLVCGALYAAGAFGSTGLPFRAGATALAMFVALAVLFILMIGLHRALEWERAVVLRLGKFHAVRGPGLFFTLPFADSIGTVIDIRIRVSDFSAQETLTLDSVTVTVDALCFWLVWDPEKAALEIEDYEDAVILSSKTALRQAISSCALTRFLESGEAIKKELQEAVDRKTNEWGVTVQYIEITDIQIPEALQDSLSRLAQAEREKKARVLLAEAEIEIAKKLTEAAASYAKQGDAMRLKILSILNEGLKAGNSMMLVPNSITEELKSGGIFGLAALSELKKEEK
jgi:regulator of protease activity HflC (stomatin/prohibitin superfamily)